MIGNFRRWARARPSSEEPVDELVEVRKLFDVDYYFAQNQDVKAAGLDPLSHFLEYGWREGRDPSPQFCVARYISTNPNYRPEDGNPLIHFLRNGGTYEHGDSSSERSGSSDDGSNRFGEVPTNQEMDLDQGTRISVPSPQPELMRLVEAHLDQDWYLSTYPKVAQSGVSPVMHYLTIGWIEGKDPTPDFSTSFYLNSNSDIRRQGINPFVHFLKHGKNEKWRRSASVVDAKIFERFEDGVLADAVDAATNLDPMVALPVERRFVTSPLQYNPLAVQAVKELRERFAGRTFDQVIAIPHVRMSGAARVAGCFTRALTQDHPAERILVVMTDGSMLEHPEWFPPDIEILDISEYFQSIQAPEIRFTVMLDLLRGVQAKTLININSRLIWDMLRTFGRQISQEYFVASYLFTWDETAKGVRVGYPIQWLRDVIDYTDVVLCDTDYLAEDVRQRFALTGPQSKRVVTLRTPLAEPPETIERDILPRQSGRPRILWAGRFDRQKRVDVLAEIARSNPQWDFWVYGKSVLNDSGALALSELENVTLNGEYASFDEIASVELDLYLYTSQWDGMPTILLDVAQYGLPIVAPKIGGIPELIDESTGWLIEPYDDAAQFANAIAEILENPEAAQGRALHLGERIRTMFSETAYVADVQEALRSDE